MANQNIVTKWLSKFGGDIYTEASTQQALQRVYAAAKQNVRDFDLHHDKLILFSDHHRGAKNRADDFRRCEAIYCAALAYYFEMGYTLCVMGDVEELWEEFPAAVLKKNAPSFSGERLFHKKGRYLRIWGNHDEIWGDPANVQKLLQPWYGRQPLHVPESLLLCVKDTGKPTGEILLVHGHQGTQNEGKSTAFAKWILHNTWRPLQQLTGFSFNTPAKDWRIRNHRDKFIYQWAASQPGLMLITGHTHAPVFASRSHRLRLIEALRDARARLDGLQLEDENARSAEIEKIAHYSAELEWLEHSMSAEEKLSPPLENPKPCYFNTGCCSFSDGDITGLEIADGEIRLVRWPDDNGNPIRKILQAPTALEEIFKQL